MAHIAIITRPGPIMDAEEVRAGMPALSGVASEFLEVLIAAATEELDGPTGWLGRSIGEQVLELRLPAFPHRCGTNGIRLPLPPAIEPVSVTYAGADGADVVMAPADYQLHGDSLFTASAFVGWPAGRNVRIRYEAGYAEIPSRIKLAVQLRVGELQMQMARDGALKKEVVEGVGSFEYDVGAEAKRSATSRAIEALLGGLRVLSI